MFINISYAQINKKAEKIYLTVKFLYNLEDDKEHTANIVLNTSAKSLISVGKDIVKCLLSYFVNEKHLITYASFSYNAIEYSISYGNYPIVNLDKDKKYTSGFFFTNKKFPYIKFYITNTGKAFQCPYDSKTQKFRKIVNGKLDVFKYVLRTNMQKGTVTIWLKDNNKILDKWDFRGFTKQQITFIDLFTQEEIHSLITRKTREENKAWWNSLDSRVKRETRKQVEQFKKQK